MIRSLEAVRGYSLEATDGRIGQVHDFYFDDATWMVRYLVADTGRWLPGRRVLLSPVALGSPDWKEHAVPVNLTRDRIEKSPSIGTDKPVSRQQEAGLHAHYEWTPYWNDFASSSAAPRPERLALEATPERITAEGDTDSGVVGARRDPHLRSLGEVLEYGIQAEDGEIGQVSDLLVDDEIWGIRYLVVDTRKWLPGRKVLLPLLWITEFDWEARKVGVDITREDVRASPEWHPDEPVNEETEKRLYDYYGRPVPER